MALSLRSSTGLVASARHQTLAAPSVLPQASGRASSVVVRAMADEPAPRPPPRLPEGAMVPPVTPEAPLQRFGFVDWAEKINSRAAMIGFFALLAVEGITGMPLLELMGITTGGGLGFEF